MEQKEREIFLAGVHIGILSIAVENRAPIMMPIWYKYEPDGHLIITTQQKSKKVTHLRAAGRFSLCVQQEELPYTFVSVEGPITSIEEADWETDIRPIAHRYLGQELGDQFVASLGDVPEVVIRMRPERWSSGFYDIQLKQ